MITLRQFVQKGILTAAALVFLGNTLSAEEAPRIWLTPTNDEAGKLTIHWQLRDETQTESILRFGKLGDDSMQAVPVGKEHGIYRAVVDISELDIEIEVSRDQFEELISDLLDQFERAVDRVLQLAGLQAQDIGLVIRTGGSSLIPAIKRILDRKFPGKVIEHDPFTSVAAGLAIADYHGLGSLNIDDSASNISRKASV